MKKTLPELLAPAGSYRALEAALSAGADAVYFGAREFNARANAENFSDEELISAIRKLKLLGVKSNIVMNTELYENELYKALSAAERVLSAGADALIVADIGLASLIKKYFPEAQIHASTQMCGENTENAKIFASLGFSRMVAAREISFKNLKYLCENSPIETEIFVHGALCVSHSGACLMSSVIGGRSGNRGECAQPCRLPYKCRGCEYPLSLRDISLAGHITDIIDTGVASLKIEGRMKSPEYVYGVVSVYRRLLDEGRNATDEETEYLSSLFSRSGFTDGYFTENISHSMLGVRTDSDKNATLLCQSEAKKERKLKLKMRAELYAGKPLKLCGTAFRAGEEFYAETEGDTSEEARTCPLSDERIKQSLIKLGTTVFESDITDISVFSDGKSIVPISSLNASRRELCAKLEKALLGEEKTYRKDFIKETFPKTASDKKSAYFVRGGSLTERAISYFDNIYLPMDEYINGGFFTENNIGIAFPPVAFDSEIPEIIEKAEKCASLGCRNALVTNLWQAEISKKLGFDICADMRLNIWNSFSAAVYEKLGFSSLIISPEVPLVKASHIGAGVARGFVAYGKIPVMTLEKCVIREINGINSPRESCKYCDTRTFSYLKDRTNTVFPVSREYKHRNVVFNSVPIYMLDKSTEGLFRHFIFTDESGEEVNAVISASERGLAPNMKFKRI